MSLRSVDNPSPQVVEVIPDLTTFCHVQLKDFSRLLSIVFTRRFGFMTTDSTSQIF